MPGQTIRPLTGDDPQHLGPYRLLGRIATGGMGRVYLARALPDAAAVELATSGGGTGRTSRTAPPGGLVAVKTLLADGPVEDRDRRRFAREVVLAQRVDSAHTAKVLDADAKAERPWMAVDYIPAPSLDELVRAAGPLPPPAVRWVASVQSAP